MKFIAFSDQHLESKLYNIPELEQDNRELFSMVIDKAIEYEVDYLVSVGDLFDNNKPSSDTIRFVTEQLRRLEGKVIPVAIAGDHSKPINGSTWESVCGFKPVNSVPEFVGVDYSDNPADVIELINHELNKKETNSVLCVFMHQQVPELWPFCEDKKKISLKDLNFANQCASMRGIFLGDIHIRRQARFHNPDCDKELFMGYCGSLGVTAANETEKEGLYFFDGEKLKNIKYDLPRQYITLDIKPDNLEEYVKDSRYATYKLGPKRPVFLVKLHDCVDIGNKLNFLYDIGFVKTTKVKKDKDGKEELVNIRSELKTADRIESVLRELASTVEYSEQVFNVAYELLTEAETKEVLDRFKETIYEKTLQGQSAGAEDN
jgi:DNA repair exonuclease SbcCD nuclease subunit